MISLSYKKSLYIQTVFTLLLTSVCSILFYLHGINQMKNMIYENIKSHISDVVYMSHKSLSTGDSADIDPYIKYKMLQLKGVKSISIFQDRNVIASTSDGIIYENLPLSMEEQDALTMFRHSLYTENFITGGIKYTVAVQITPEVAEHAKYTFKRDIFILTLSILLIVSSVQFVIYYLLYYVSFSRFYEDIKNRRFDIIYPITELTGLSRLVRGLVASLNKKTEETESQKELFRTLFYNLPIASFYKDKDGKYLGGNEEFCRLIGMEETEILGKTAYDVLDETTAEELEARDKSLYENPDTMQIYEEDIHIKWLKKTRSVVYYKCALRGRDKTPLGVVAVMMDISHKKRQERLNRLQIAIADAFLLENEYDIFRRLSSAVISEFGCRGAYVTYIDAAGAEVNPLFYDADTEVKITTSIVDNEDVTGHMTLYGKDSGFTFEDREDALYIANLIAPNLKHWYRNKYHEQNLQNEKKALEMIVQQEMENKKRQEQIIFEQKKFADMGLMINAVAHHWRQPLNAMGLMVQTLRDQYEDKELDSEQLEFFETNSMRLIKYLSETIDNFRLFFASDKEKIRFNAPDELFNLLSLLDIQLKNKNITITALCSCKDEPMDCFDLRSYQGCDNHSAEIFGFLGEFKQSVINILYNAVDAVQDAEKNGRIEKGSITVRIQITENELNISIHDNGGGIPEDIMFMIFDPYFSTKGEGKGTGLGLYMTRLMIENHMGGRIRAENRDGGAVFTITLPLCSANV